MAALHNFEDGKEEQANPRYGEIEEIEDLVEKRFKQFKNFAIFNHPPLDHNFILKKPGKESNKIKREWEMLHLVLPNSIYVRCYETRPDLMRAMIIGPDDTLYHHGLFCFDIRFPNNYPAQPPELFYHSYGNLNLNLKKNLTAGAQKKPKRYTILQVLTAIQHSISKGNTNLNKTDVIKQVSETMLCVLRSPPTNFEGFVFGYFRTQAHHILMNCKSHMGSDDRMKRLFFALVRAFEANGTYCQHHYDKNSYDQALLEEEKGKKESSSFTSKTANTFKFLFFPASFGVSSFSL